MVGMGTLGPGTSNLTRSRRLTNNAYVPRKFVAVALSMAVQLATLSAPLVHVHPDDHATAHHRAHEVHAHLERHPTASRAADESAVDHPDDDDRAVFVHVFVGVVTAGFDLPGVVPAFLVLPQPGERPSLRALYGVHGHDPPFLRSLSPRAPPAFLS